LLTTLMSLVIFKVGTVHGFFYGDDFLVYKSHNTPGGYSNSFLSSFVQQGGGKYRPLFTPLLNLIFSWHGNSYEAFHFYQILLLTLCALIFAAISFKLTQNGLITILSPVLVLASRFNWYGQTAVHGIMELLAIAWFLLSIYFLISWTETYKSGFFYLAVLTLSASSFTHERYVLAPVIIWRVLLFARHIRLNAEIRTRQISVLLLIPLFNWAVKTYIIHVSFFNGGGEASVLSSSGFMIVHRLVASFFGVLGFSSGVNDYFTKSGWGLQDPWGRNALSDWSRYFRIILVLVMILYFIYIIRHKRVSNDKNMDDKKKSDETRRLIIIAAFFGSILPAATVISRVEGRWLFGPELLFWLLLISFIKAIERRKLRLLSTMLISIALLLSISGRQKYDQFSYDRRLAINVMSRASLDAPEKLNWSLTIKSNEVNPWMFGYGASFSQLKNPPDFVLFNSESCPRPCLEIETYEGDIQSRWNTKTHD